MRFIYTVIFIFAAGTLQAQYVLQGMINDAGNQQPIFGASVLFPDLKRGTSTDANGKFTILNLPKGKFLMEVKYIGYASWVQVVEIKGSMNLEINLSGTITELNEIVISGVSHSTELKKNPVSIATLNAESLISNNATNIIDNISQKAGVYQITTGAAISKPVIRGLGYNRIITLYDGIRQEGQQWGDEHGIEMDEFSVDRVEIIKGAGSLMYGSDGIGGVINFLAPNPVREGSVEGHWITNYQSNNGLFANSISSDGNLKGFYWSARASQKIAKDYQNAYDGRVFNSGFRENNFNLLGGINKSWGYAQLTASSFNQAVGLVEGERDASGNFIFIKNINGIAEETTASESELNTYSLFIPRQNINHLRFSNNTNLFWGNARMQLTLGYQKNIRKEFGDPLEIDRANLFFDLQTLNYNTVAYFPEIKGWNFSLGVSGMWQHNFNKGIEFLIPDYALRDGGVVSFVKKNFKKLDVAAGVRVDQRKISIHALYLDANGRPSDNVSDTRKFSAGDLSFSNYSASAGFAYQFSDVVSLKANASRGYRAPNISELASNGRHEGSLRYEYGNYDLKAENSFQTDLSLLINSPHVSAETSIYRNTINNFIFVEKLLSGAGTDSIPDTNDPVPAYAYIQGKAQLVGGEFSIDLHPHPLDWMHFENSLSLVYAENKSTLSDSSKYLPFTPPLRLQSELRANLKPWKRLANIFFKIQYQYHGSQKRVLLENQTEYPTASYSLWNAGFGSDLINKRSKTIFSLYLTIANIFDEAYQNHLSRLKYADDNPVTGRRGVFNMGRNFNIKLAVPVSHKKK